MILEIKDLHVEIKGKEILKGINLELDLGKTYALMGKNGSGKSTLAYTLMGHPNYEITKGKIIFNGEDITQMPVNERSKLGLFLSFQHPREVEGITIKELLKNAIKEQGEKNIFKILEVIKKNSEILEVSENLLKRSLNRGFSGGEKKKIEILQLLSLEPKLAILDETDSGLDIDSLKTISKAINVFRDQGKTSLIITHYKRILEHVKPDKVLIMEKGKIVKEGNFDLVERLEKEGYKFLENEAK